MRNLNLKIDVSDEEAAAIEAELRSGEFACVSEMVRTAVRTYLDRRHLSDTRSIARDADRRIEGAFASGLACVRKVTGHGPCPASIGMSE